VPCLPPLQIATPARRAAGQFDNVEANLWGRQKSNRLLSDLACRRRPPMPHVMNRDFGTSPLKGAFPGWPHQAISDCVAWQRRARPCPRLRVPCGGMALLQCSKRGPLNGRDGSKCEELTQGTLFRVAPNNRHGVAERKRPSPYRRAPALHTGVTTGLHQHRSQGVNLICCRGD
jgi:hypothetical protein